MSDLSGQLKDIIERLTSALYRVTELMSDKEPIKWTLRDNALNVHNEIMSIKKDRYKYQDTIFSITSIRSLLSLFSNGIYVSKRNFEILDREYGKLKDILEREKDNLITDKTITLPEIDLRSSSLLHNDFGNQAISFTGTDSIDLENSSNHFIKEAIGENFFDAVSLGNKELNNGKQTIERAELANDNNKKNFFVGNNERKEKLLSILKLEGAKTAGALSVLVPGVSSKTIQRDLVDLSQKGFVYSKGEKRWRKYYLSGLNEAEKIA